MTFEEKKEYVKSKGRRVAHNVSEKKLDSIITELDNKKEEEKTVRMV